MVAGTSRGLPLLPSLSPLYKGREMQMGSTQFEHKQTVCREGWHWMCFNIIIRNHQWEKSRNPSSASNKEHKNVFDMFETLFQCLHGLSCLIIYVNNFRFSNLGNTCYMNAILQSLFSLPSFSNDMLRQSIPWKKVPINALLRYCLEFWYGARYKGCWHMLIKHLTENFCICKETCHHL